MKKRRAKKSRKEQKAESEVASVETKEAVKVLIIDSDTRDWDSTFKDVKGVVIDVCEWDQIFVQSDSTQNSKPIVSIYKPNKAPPAGSWRDQPRTLQPDFVIVRKLVCGLTDREDYSNALYGLLFSGIPSINSFSSIVQCSQRAIVYRSLLDIQRKLAAENGNKEDKFPLIPMSYYSHFSTMRFTPEFPFVAKVGSAEAGYGKMRFKDSDSGFDDFRTMIALHHDYCTLEPFIEKREYDLRIQRIGDKIRAYSRRNSNWKGNVGTCILEEIEVTPQFQLWTDEVRKLFGGLDIFTVDAIHTEDGKDYILEINDTASGFAPKNQQEDMQHVLELALSRMVECGLLPESD